MSKRFKAPTLPEITYEYLGLYRKPARLKDFEALEKSFQKALIRTNKAEDVRAALALDTRRELPVQLKSPLYERLLSIEGRSLALLREYAQVMYEFGPEFTPYADRLWDEADALEEGAIEDEGR
ncbi:MAG: hypothetical protein ACOCXZ_00320 [Chloroflexota bacterium]